MDTTSREASQSQVAGIQLSTLDPSDAARWVCEAASSSRGPKPAIHLVNAYTISLIDKSGEYRGLFAPPSINFADGKPLGWVSRMRGVALPQVRGPRLFEMVLDQGRAFKLKHYLLGGTDETLELIRSNAERLYPGVQIVGWHSPPFRTLAPHEQESQDQKIVSSGANIVWVGLGTPKQDYEAVRLAGSTRQVTVAVGAAFDFFAGTKSEAPELLKKLGLEWAYRFASEPRRLWRRYIFGNARFILAVSRRRRTRD